MAADSDRNDGEAAATTGELPSWLLAPERYDPPTDRDAFIMRSSRAVASVLARLRLDDGQATPLSPSAPVKLLVGLALILLTSLSTNYAFVLAVLAGVLVRVALLPSHALRRVVDVAAGAAGLTALVMLPALLLGQPQSLLIVTTKVVVSVCCALTMTLSCPVHELTGALRQLHVSNLAIMTVDLALRGIVTLGTTTLEVLEALRLRSVGRNRSKGSALGGVGGIVLLKANKAAQETSDAMRCRGFTGRYQATRASRPGACDIVWLALLAAVFAAFLYLQKQV